MERVQNKSVELVVEDYYIINEQAMAIIPFYTDNGELYSKVIEKYNVRIIAKSPKKIIEESCVFYGCSMSGRRESALTILKGRRMIPIIVSSRDNLCMVPICSPQSPKCVWVAYQNVAETYPKQNQALILLKNKKMVKVEISYKTLEGKLDSAARLVSTLDIRNKQMNDFNKKDLIAEESEIYSV